MSVYVRPQYLRAVEMHSSWDFWGQHQWRNRGEGAPQRLLTGKFLLTYGEKRDKENKENGAEKRKIDQNWKWKEEKVIKIG